MRPPTRARSRHATSTLARPPRPWNEQGPRDGPPVEPGPVASRDPSGVARANAKTRAPARAIARARRNLTHLASDERGSARAGAEREKAGRGPALFLGVRPLRLDSSLPSACPPRAHVSGPRRAPCDCADGARRPRCRNCGGGGDLRRGCVSRAARPRLDRFARVVAVAAAHAPPPFAHPSASRLLLRAPRPLPCPVQATRLTR